MTSQHGCLGNLVSMIESRACLVISRCPRFKLSHGSNIAAVMLVSGMTFTTGNRSRSSAGMPSPGVWGIAAKKRWSIALYASSCRPNSDSDLTRALSSSSSRARERLSSVLINVPVWKITALFASSKTMFCFWRIYWKYLSTKPLLWTKKSRISSSDQLMSWVVCELQFSRAQAGQTTRWQSTQKCEQGRLWLGQIWTASRCSTVWVKASFRVWCRPRHWLPSHKLHCMHRVRAVSL